MVTQKEIKESNRDGVSMGRKMVHLKLVYKGLDSDHKPTTTITTQKRKNQLHITKTRKPTYTIKSLHKNRTSQIQNQSYQRTA